MASLKRTLLAPSLNPWSEKWAENGTKATKQKQTLRK